MTAFLKGIETSLSRTYRLALLDLDGVVYRGANPIRNAATGISQAESQGMTISYTTNNASRTPKVVADQLRGFGLELDDHQIVTSSIVAARMLRHNLHAGAKVLVIGADHLREEVRANGLEVVGAASDHPEAVIQGWNPKQNWEDLAEAAYAVGQGARFFATNMDRTIPREGGIAPGNGAMVETVAIASGKSPEASAGKPESAMYDEARQMLADGAEPIPVKECLPVGDRLDTDIEAANRGGYDSLVVLTGVASVESIILAEPKYRPTYISADLLGLVTPHAAPEKSADQIWHCGRATAVLRDGTVELHSSEAHDGVESTYDPRTDLDAVRASACAVWEYRDQGHDVHDLRLPQFRIGA